jgi:RNA polymerase sigma factor (sigma-70 family)
MNYERINEDGVKTTITTDADGIVTYAVESPALNASGQATSVVRKTEFPLDTCNEYTFHFGDGTSQTMVCGEGGVELLHITTLRGEARLWNNNEERETDKHSRIDDFPDTYGELKDKTVDVEGEVLRSLDSEEVRAAVGKLKPADQLLMNRLYLDEHTVSQAELATELGIQEKSISQKSRRARAKLQLLLTL